MQLADKVVVVTGGGNGIGQQIVLALLAKDAIVAAADINSTALDATWTAAGAQASRLSLHTGDISSRESVQQLATTVVEQHGQVDAIVNNAGVIHPFASFHRLDDAAIDRVLNVNLHGTIHMIRAFMPLLLARPEAHIVNVSSMGGLFAFPKQTLYGASKAAVKLLSEGLYAELRRSNIGVSVVYPGAVKTNISHNCDAHPEKMEKFERFHPGISPAKVARRIVRAMEKNQFRVVIGLDSRFLGLLYRLLPTTTIRMMGRLIQLVMPD
ncbi:MAG: short-chain dehydrogenase [Pseudomonadales bacterium]|nr:short-chain dehydrogenase [Pseudomonadales bacterium]